MEDSGWMEYRKLVLNELQRSNDRLTRIENDIGEIKEKLAVLQTKVYFTSSTLAFLISTVVAFFTTTMKA
jgi:hypothetical protein